MNCDHSSVGAPDVVQFFPCCHRYKRGDRFLDSVSSVLKIWPEKPSWDSVDRDVVENARQRGVEVDALLSQWLTGTLSEIPAGARQDAVELFLKLMPWWEKTFNGSEAQTQVVLADEEIAGTADIVIVSPSGVYDLKCVSQLQKTYPLQVGAYCHLHEATYGTLPERCGIIHLNKSKPPTLVPLEVLTVVSEFRIVRDMWRLWKRRSA